MILSVSAKVKNFFSGWWVRHINSNKKTKLALGRAGGKGGGGGRGRGEGGKGGGGGARGEEPEGMGEGRREQQQQQQKKRLTPWNEKSEMRNKRTKEKSWQSMIFKGRGKWLASAPLSFLENFTEWLKIRQSLFTTRTLTHFFKSRDCVSYVLSLNRLGIVSYIWESYSVWTANVLKRCFHLSVIWKSVGRNFSSPAKSSPPAINEAYNYRHSYTIILFKQYSYYTVVYVLPG